MTDLARVSFEDVLARKLGPYRELLGRRGGVDPAALWYRREAGIELRVRPERSWSEVDLIGAHGERQVWPRHQGLTIAGLTTWTHATELRVLSPRELWRAVEGDLLCWCEHDPDVPLTGRSGVLSGGYAGPIRRRRSMWPAPLVARGDRIEAFPFMPRGCELAGVEPAGVRLASFERGFEVFAASIVLGEARNRVLRRLLHRLDGSHTAAELIEAFDGEERSFAALLLELLDGVTALEAGPKITAFPAEKRGRVTWLGHAAVLLEAGGQTVLVDPLFFASSEPEERWLSTPRFDPRTLPPIDAILVTHGDNDHLNPAALAQLPPDVPVLVPRLEQRPSDHQVDLRGVLKLLGFERIVELDHWSSYDLGTIQITACPFVGEDWGLKLPQATYLVEAPGLSAFFSADAFRMDDVYRRLAERKIDLAFMGVSGCAESASMPKELGYGNFYRRWIPAERRNQWLQHCAGPRDALESLRLFEPRFAFGYAAGGASWIKTEYSDRGAPEELARQLADSGLSTKPLELELGVPMVVPQRS